MESANGVREEKISDELTRLCDALAEVRKQARWCQAILPQLLDKSERRAARKMISAEALELMRIAAGG